MENQEQIKQSSNDVFIVGKLKEKNINFKTFDGKEMATGYVVVATENNFGKGEVRVSVMQNKITKEGKENNLYKALVTVANSYKSMKETGDIETADFIKINGSMGDGTYYNTNSSEFVEKIDIRATSMKKIDKINKLGKKEEDRAVACVEGYIASITPKEGELEVKLIAIGYGGGAIPITGIVEKDLALPFQNLYQVGTTTTLNMAIVNTVETEDVQKSIGFGNGLGEKIERTIVKNVIFGGENPNYNGYTHEQISRAVALREVANDKKKEKALARDKTSAPTSGFGTPQGNAPTTTPAFTGVSGGFPMPGTFGA